VPLSSQEGAMAEHENSIGESDDCGGARKKRRGHVPWLRKFLAHGNGIAIVRAYTSADWFHDYVVPYAPALCFPLSKTKFFRPDGSIGKQPGHGVVLIAMGEICINALERSGLGWFVDRRSKVAPFTEKSDDNSHTGMARGHAEEAHAQAVGA
jgi:hypothetical protein